MKSLQKQGFSAGCSSSPPTRIPALSRQVCQKFARNHDFVTNTLSDYRSVREPPPVTTLGAILLPFAARLPWRSQNQHRQTNPCGAGG